MKTDRRGEGGGGTNEVQNDMKGEEKRGERRGAQAKKTT